VRGNARLDKLWRIPYNRAIMPRTDQGVAASRGRYHVVPRTLCFVTHGDDVLLLKGAPTKRIWPGRYNGLGGHVERDEDIRAAAERELHEESGLAVSGLRLCGIANIDTGEEGGIMLFVFRAEATSREFTPSPEGTLDWVPRGQIADLPLVEDLPMLLPRALDAPAHALPFFAAYSYDEQDRLVVRFHE
jgi:8-oxo-dGTP diphosphatase